MSPCYHSKYLLIIVTFILIWEIKSTRWLVLFSLPRVPWSGAALPTDKCHQNSQLGHNTQFIVCLGLWETNSSHGLICTLFSFSDTEFWLKWVTISVGLIYFGMLMGILYWRGEELHGWSRNVIYKLSSSPFLSVNWNPTLSVIGWKSVYTENIQSDIYLANLLWQKVAHFILLSKGLCKIIQ